MEITVALPKTRFLNKEAIAMRLRVRNTGPTPIEVPNPEDNRNAQPVYTLTGPSYPAGYRFHFRLVARHDPSPPALVEPEMTVALAPGTALEAELPLHAMVSFPEPGLHTLVVSIEATGGDGSARAESAPIQFVVARPSIQSMELALDAGVQASSPIRVLCLVGEPGTTVPGLYQAIFHEERPDLGEISLAALVSLADTDARATSVVAAWSNHARLDQLHDRFGWRGPRSELGFCGLPEGPLTAPVLPDETMRLVRPALLVESGTVMVLVFGRSEAHGQALRMFALFDAARARGAATERWLLPLPAAPAGARAAAAPPTVDGGGCAAVLVLAEGDGSRLMLVQASADLPPRTRIAVLPGVVPLPAGEPGLWIDGEGAVHASVLLTSAERSNELIVADVTWPPGDGEATIARARAAWLPVPARAGSVTHSVSRRSLGRREWLVLLVDGQMICSRSPDQARPLRGVPSLPLSLLAMSEMTYLLTVDDHGLPRLDPLY